MIREPSTCSSATRPACVPELLGARKNVDPCTRHPFHPAYNTSNHCYPACVANVDANGDGDFNDPGHIDSDGLRFNPHQ